MNSALQYISQNSGGILGLDDLIPVKDGSSPHTNLLHDLHPAAKDPVEEFLLKDNLPNSLPFDLILFEKLMSLARIAKSQPHAAFAAFTRGIASKWTYVSRTIPGIDDLLRPLEEIIHQHFIPAITGYPPCSPCERQLLALPLRLGGLGLSNPSSDSQTKFEASKQVTASLVALIVLQHPNEFVTDEPKRTKAPV